MTFNPSADIEEVISHLKVMFWNGETTVLDEATLVNAGSGTINIQLDGGTVWELHGDGTDITYTLTDKTGGHGPKIYSMEWVN